MNEILSRKYSVDDQTFRSEGFFKFHAAVDELENLHFVANNQLFYSQDTKALIQVQFISWIFDTSSNKWSNYLFYGHKSLVLRYLLCVHQGKLYLLCTDFRANHLSDHFLISVDTKANFRVTVLKKISHPYCDVEDGKIYFIDKANKVNIFHIEKNQQGNTCVKFPNARYFFISDDKVFTFIDVYDLSTGQYISRIPGRSDRYHLSYVCKTQNCLCFTAEKDYDHLHLFHTVEFRWIKLHLPLKRMLKKCRVCFSGKSSRLYFTYLNRASKSMRHAQIAFFPTATMNGSVSVPDNPTNLMRFVIKSNTMPSIIEENKDESIKKWDSLKRKIEPCVPIKGKSTKYLDRYVS